MLINFSRTNDCKQDEIYVASGQGKSPLQLTIAHHGAEKPIIIVYIFEHTTVQEFLDIIDMNRTYEYVFEGEVINDIPPYYFMITLGLQSGAIIEMREQEPDEDDMRDPEYTERTPQRGPKIYRV